MRGHVSWHLALNTIRISVSKLFSMQESNTNALYIAEINYVFISAKQRKGYKNNSKNWLENNNFFALLVID